MTLRFPSSEDIVLGLTVPPPASDWFGDVFRHVPVTQLRLSEKEQAYHAAIFGTSGSGKSKMLQSVFLQHVSRNHGVGLVDPHSDLGLDVIKYLISQKFFLKAESFERLIYLDFANGAFVPFNVLNQPYDPHTIGLNALEAMLRVWPSLEEAPLFQTLFLAATSGLIQCKLPITYLYQMLTDGEFRNECLKKVTDPLIHQTFRNYYERLGREQAQAAGSTLRRAFLLSFSPVIRNALGQPDNWLNFRKIMDSGKSIIISLGGLEDETKRLLGAMLMVAIEQAALSRVDSSERRPFNLLVDEWGSFAAQEKTIGTILSQTRKFNLRIWLAAQSLAQVSSARLSGALENCRLMIAFGLGRESAEIQAKHIGKADPFAVKEQALTMTQHAQYMPVLEQFEGWTQELQNLPTRVAYVRLQGKPAVKITTLNVGDPKVDPGELKEVLSEYKRRYQRTAEEAEAALRRIPSSQGVEDATSSTPSQASSKPDLFENLFRRRNSKEKEKLGN